MATTRAACVCACACVCSDAFDAWTEIAKGIHLMEQFEISWWHIPPPGYPEHSNMKMEMGKNF